MALCRPSSRLATRGCGHARVSAAPDPNRPRLSPDVAVARLAMATAPGWPWPLNRPWPLSRSAVAVAMLAAADARAAAITRVGHGDHPKLAAVIARVGHGHATGLTRGRPSRDGLAAHARRTRGRFGRGHNLPERPRQPRGREVTTVGRGHARWMAMATRAGWPQPRSGGHDPPVPDGRGQIGTLAAATHGEDGHGHPSRSPRPHASAATRRPRGRPPSPASEPAAHTVWPPYSGWELCAAT